MSRSQPLLDPPAQVKEILRRLKQAGHSAFVVGGAVRDAVLGRSVQDWDVATSASPDLVSTLFPRVIPTGLRHGTVTVRLEGQNIEVSTFRGASILEDLAHRDFTMDAMAYDPEGPSLLDPHGGVKDAKGGLLRAVGDPTERLREDPLRALRAVRLAAELDLRIHRELLHSLGSVAMELSRVAPERIREELQRIVLSQAPSWPLWLLVKSGLLERLIPELWGFPGVEGEGSAAFWSTEHLFKTVQRLPARPALRWAGLLHRLGTRSPVESTQGPQDLPARMAREILLRLRMSRKQIDQAAHIIFHHAIPHRSLWPEQEVRQLLFKVGARHIQDAILLRLASLAAAGANPERISSLEELSGKVKALFGEPKALAAMHPVLGGKDVMELLGLKPGPRVGEILASLEEAVLSDPSLNKREVLTRWLLDRYHPASEPG